MTERMLELYNRSGRLSRGTSRGTPQEKEMLQREIESTDWTIDKLVYKLYALTEAEIRLVEAG
jgi:hypothetical protein